MNGRQQRVPRLGVASRRSQVRSAKSSGAAQQRPQSFDLIEARHGSDLTFRRGGTRRKPWGEVSREGRVLLRWSR